MTPEILMMNVLIHLALVAPFAVSSPLASSSKDIQYSYTFSNYNRRSEISDLVYSPKRCPPGLPFNCKKCPLDRRCHPQTNSDSDTNSNVASWPFLDPQSAPEAELKAKPANRPRPHSWTYDPSEPAALTGPQLANFDGLSSADNLQLNDLPSDSPADAGTVQPPATKPKTGGKCPLTQCGTPGSPVCDKSTTCKKGYCACKRGLKTTGAYQGRGRNESGKEIVFVNPGDVCETPCDDVACSEIHTLTRCFETRVGNASTGASGKPGKQGKETLDKGIPGQQEVGVKKSGTGAINVPGVTGDAD